MGGDTERLEFRPPIRIALHDMDRRQPRRMPTHRQRTAHFAAAEDEDRVGIVHATVIAVCDGSVKWRGEPSP